MNFCHEFEQINRMIFPDADFPCVREKLQAVFDEIILSDCTCKEDLLKSAFFLLRKINNLDFPEYRTPDIDELLFDRLGVIYEALY